MEILIAFLKLFIMMIRIASRIYEYFIGDTVVFHSIISFNPHQAPKRWVPSLFLFIEKGSGTQKAYRAFVDGMGERRQNQDLNPETVKLTTRAETFEIHWGLAGDLVKTVGSGAISPDFQIQWAWGGLQDLMHPPDDSDGRGLEADFAQRFSILARLFCSSSKIPC